MSRPPKICVIVEGMNYSRFKGDYIWGNLTEMYEQVNGPGIIKSFSTPQDWFVVDRVQQKKLLICRLGLRESLLSGRWEACADCPPIDGNFQLTEEDELVVLRRNVTTLEEQVATLQRQIDDQEIEHRQRVRELEDQLVQHLEEHQRQSPVEEIRGPMLELSDTNNFGPVETPSDAFVAEVVVRFAENDGSGDQYAALAGRYVWSPSHDMYCQDGRGSGIIGLSGQTWVIALGTTSKLYGKAGQSVCSDAWYSYADMRPARCTVSRVTVHDLPTDAPHRIAADAEQAAVQRIQALREELSRHKGSIAKLRQEVHERDLKLLRANNQLPHTGNDEQSIDNHMEEVLVLRQYVHVKHKLRDPTEQILDFDFPSGRQIVTDYSVFCRRLRNDLGDVISCLQDPSTSPKAYPVHDSAVPSIVHEVYSSAISFVDEHTAAVKQTLAREFCVIDIDSDSIAKRFYLRTMQRVKYTAIVRSIAGVAESKCDSDRNIRKLKETMNRMTTEGALDSTATTVADIFKGFATTYLQCVLSDPPCLLYPLPNLRLPRNAEARGKFADAANSQPRGLVATDYIVLAPALFFLDTDSTMPSVAQCKGVFGYLQANDPRRLEEDVDPLV